MGVPKFAKFICERYPCILELLNDYQIPEFDNLYLDMNGIIHCCSHPNDADAHFRITEETIFKNIFHYVEILFRTIKPQKLFFMAVDGVAPRAKINQQRGRRFRAAKDAEIVEARARARGETMPEESKFDSNCITPGTLFMAKLTEQLKYFVTYKISTDKLWQKCKIILSGPEVPGEGEYKIMDYIRYLKSQPDHDPNTRHCLYGLDADLIMLSLCTHEPHFTVLREEVKYNKSVQNRIMPEKIKFCLLHISLLREYMEHEFEPIRDKLHFSFDIERIIDDWILMGFLIGNDFIPHLPNLHIANGALPILYQAYREILPTLDGYINEAGLLNLERFEKFMERLAVIDIERFTEHLVDLKYFESKTNRKLNENEETRQKKLNESKLSPKNTPTLSLSPKVINKDLNALIQSTDEILLGHSNEEEQNDIDSDNDMNNLEFLRHKRDYYMNKFAYENVDADVLQSQAEAYVTAIQWNLHYYYDGCCSWSWYYPHHYAPYISDIKGFQNLKFNFELGVPFLPFQQLLAVLPAASKNLLPQAYQSLLDKQSPIIDYYPEDFKTDINEKKQEWEGIVLIPFINEKRLIEAMEPLNSLLTPEEVKRNQHGPMNIIHYTEENFGTITAPDYFPTIESHAKIIPVYSEEIHVPQNKLVKGLAKNVKLHTYYCGFPTMQHIKHTAYLHKSKVKVFEHQSREDNMIIAISPINVPLIEQLASDILGKIVYVKWPHLMEAHVIAISNGERKFIITDSNLSNDVENLRREEISGDAKIHWNVEAENIASSYKNRFGIDVGEVKMIIHARPIIGRRYILISQGRLSLEKEWSNYPISYAYQSIVRNIQVEDEGFIGHKNVIDIYVPKSICFMIGHPHYGAMGETMAPGIDLKSGRVKVAMSFSPEPNFDLLKREQNELRMLYMHGSIAAQRLGISSHLLSRITGSIFVLPNSNEQSERKQLNIGLNLKFNKKNEELPGYTRKMNGQWLYSSKSIGLIRDYMEKFPLLFERLAQNLGNDVYNENDLFSEGSLEIMNASKWIKEQPFRNIEVRNCNWQGLDPEIIQKISIEINKYLEQEADLTKTVLMQVKPHLLHKPGLSVGNVAPDPKSKHKIFDRIIVVREDLCVPLGYKGTIVSIQSSGDNPDCNLYDILFDKSFIGNISYAGSATNRRYKLLAVEFINISHGIRVEQNITDIFTVPEKVHRKKSTTSESILNVKPSAFASFNKHDNFLPVFCKNKEDSQHSQLQIPIRVMMKNSELKDSLNSPIKRNDMKKNIHTQNTDEMLPQKQLNALPTPTLTTINKPQSMKPDHTTEFQLLWNELHKQPVLPEAPIKPTTFPALLPPRPSLLSAGESPQDPSAFLKAVLKISDDKSTNNSSQSCAVTERKSFGCSQTPPVPSVPPVPSSSTPTLVQQLFDHARQASRKDNISYCTLLSNHFQSRGIGLPRYFYSTNDKNLVRAQIALADMRNYQGEWCPNHEFAAESAALTVYKKLNLGETVKPQHYFDHCTRDTWGNIPPLNIQSIMPLRQFPDAQKPTVRPPISWNQPQLRMLQQSSGLSQASARFDSNRSQPMSIENKFEEKQQNATPFVPLQAQKKTRTRKSRETPQLQLNAPEIVPPKLQKAQKTKGNANSKGSPKIIKSDKSTKTNETTESTKENPSQGQKINKIPRQRKSRIAANFSASPASGTANGSETY